MQHLFIQEVKGKWSVMVLLALHQWPHLSYRDGGRAWCPLFLTLDEKREDLKLTLLSQRTKGSTGEVLFGHLKTFVIRLPWWLSGKESACQCRRHGFDPWSGKIPHDEKQLSLCAATNKPSRAGELQLTSPCDTTTEACAP